MPDKRGCILLRSWPIAFRMAVATGRCHARLAAGRLAVPTKAAGQRWRRRQPYRSPQL